MTEVSNVNHVAYFPNLDTLRGNPYWDLLASSLSRRGVEVLENNPNTMSLRWLLRNRRTISVLHYHYVQEEYAYEYDYARLRWVVRFFRNLVAAHLLGYRVIWTMHNLKPAHPLRPTWVEHTAHWVIARLSNAVIVHCESARELLRERYGRRSNVFVMQHPNFIDAYPNTLDRKLARAGIGLAETQKVILFLGGIRPNKGIETLIAAFKSYEDVEARLLIVGTPQVDPGYTQHLINQSAEDSRILLKIERIADDDIQLYFNAADLVVLPFASVLTSSSLVLAMSFSRPVIVPRLGCMADLVTPSVGWLYEPGSIAELTRTISLALQSDLDAIGHNARTRVSAHSWERFAQETMVAYGLDVSGPI